VDLATPFVWALAPGLPIPIDLAIRADPTKQERLLAH